MSQTQYPKGRRWEVIYYEDEKGNCPVLDFIKTRTIQEQAKFNAWVQQLTIQGPLLPRPYADLLRDGIHELRIKLKRDQVRSLYFFYHRTQIIMTHSFVKTQSAVEDREIRRAIRIREEYLKKGGN